MGVACVQTLHKRPELQRPLAGMPVDEELNDAWEMIMQLTRAWPLLQESTACAARLDCDGYAIPVPSTGFLADQPMPSNSDPSTNAMPELLDLDDRAILSRNSEEAYAAHLSHASSSELQPHKSSSSTVSLLGELFKHTHNRPEAAQVPNSPSSDQSITENTNVLSFQLPPAVHPIHEVKLSTNAMHPPDSGTHNRARTNSLDNSAHPLSTEPPGAEDNLEAAVSLPLVTLRSIKPTLSVRFRGAYFLDTEGNQHVQHDLVETPSI